jgi:hypothetical protein
MRDDDKRNIERRKERRNTPGAIYSTYIPTNDIATEHSTRTLILLLLPTILN